MSDRLEVRKTYKLFVGGAFPRSESGRTYEVTHGRRGLPRQCRPRLPQGRPGRRAGRAQGLRRRGARPPPTTGARCSTGSPRSWRAVAAQFADDVRQAEGVDVATAAAQVDAAIDRWVWYAGWTDKLAQVLGSANPVAGPYFNFSVPEPTGVVAAVAPQDSSLLGLVSVVAPIVAAGNAVLVIASTSRPIPAITLAEVLATSDVPGGAINILTGDPAEMMPWLASHADVNALDLAGIDRSAARHEARARRGRHRQAGPSSRAVRGLAGRPRHRSAAPASSRRRPSGTRWASSCHVAVAGQRASLPMSGCSRCCRSATRCASCPGGSPPMPTRSTA